MCIFFLLQNQKEPVPVVAVATVEVAVVVEEAAAVAAVEILEGVDPPDWEDYSRPECRS